MPQKANQIEHPCPNCGGTARFYAQIDNSPCLQNVLYRSRSDAQHTQTVNARFFVCESCVYLFNPDFSVKETHYDLDYNNDQSRSRVYREHMQSVSQFIGKYIDQGDKVLEIGCGNGQLLGLLKDNGANIRGYDPSYQGDFGVEEYISKDYWSPQQDDPHDLIILRHTLEGLHQPTELFQQIAEISTNDTTLYIEFNDLGSILRNGEMCNLYHECARYFSITSISMFLAKFGFEVHAIEHYAGRNWLGIIARRLIIGQAKIANMTLMKPYKRILIWGIAGRSIQFITHNSVPLESIEFAVDLDPRKQGKYLPVKGQKILSPEEAIRYKPELVIVLNSAYKEEVRKHFNYTVKILTAKDIYQSQ